jgi:hypothetical protein
VLEGAHANRQLGPVGVGFDHRRCLPGVELGQASGRLVGSDEVWDVTVDASRCGAFAFQQGPDAVADGVLDSVDLGVVTAGLCRGHQGQESVVDLLDSRVVAPRP